MKKYEEAVARIKNFAKIKVNRECRGSYIALIEEYKRRSSKFKLKYSSKEDEWYFFYKPVEIINESVPDFIEEEIEELMKGMLENVGWVTANICKLYLEWAYLQDKENKIAIEYNDLYEPLIVLNERGGNIYYSENYFCCGEKFWKRGDKFLLNNNIEALDMSKKFLDRLDEN